jgi:hypothetical protein
VRRGLRYSISFLWRKTGKKGNGVDNNLGNFIFVLVIHFLYISYPRDILSLF